MRRREILEGIRIREGHCRGEEIRFGPKLERLARMSLPKQASIAVMKQDVLADSKFQYPDSEKQRGEMEVEYRVRSGIMVFRSIRSRRFGGVWKGNKRHFLETFNIIGI